MTTLAVRSGRVLGGTATVPGDKSISHRVLMVAAAAEGTSRLDGLPDGEDVRSTIRCLRDCGVAIRPGGGGVDVVSRGIDGWVPPPGPLHCGNSGTTIRMLSGLAARRPYESVLDGDASLRRRPMGRVARPLRDLGAVVEPSEDGRPPVRIRGGRLTGRLIELEVASAQVKSAVLLAGLGAAGVTGTVEPALSRDHTERLLDALGVPVRSTPLGDGRVRAEVMEAEVPSFEADVPGDPSSAAFLVAAAVLSGEVRVEGVCLNPTRIGFLETLRRMEADVRWEAVEERNGEPVGWIEARRSSLRGTAIEGPAVPVLVDELPLLAVLATQAEGTTVVEGAGELRLKESDRIAAVGSGLRAMGAGIEERPDGFVVHGGGVLLGAEVDAAGDHRIAMAFAVAGLVAAGETKVTGAECAAVSWPGFAAALRALGADVEER